MKTYECHKLNTWIRQMQLDQDETKHNEKVNEVLRNNLTKENKLKDGFKLRTKNINKQLHRKILVKHKKGLGYEQGKFSRIVESRLDQTKKPQDILINYVNGKNFNGRFYFLTDITNGVMIGDISDVMVHI